MDSKSIFKNLKLLSDTFTDISVVVEGKSYNCHKVILSCVSEFFQRLLLSDCKETAKGEIILEDIKSRTFQIFLEFIYNGGDEEILEDLALNTLIDLLEFGEKYLILCISKQCTEILTKRLEEDLGIEQMIQLFEKAYIFNNDKLIAATQEGFETFGDEKMNCEKVLGLRADIFKEYVKCSDGILSEKDRFNMIETWITNQSFHTPGTVYSWIDVESELEPNINEQQSNLVIVKQLLNLVAFENMSVDDFHVGPGKSDILDPHDKYMELYNISSIQSKEIKELYKISSIQSKEIKDLKTRRGYGYDY